MQRAGFLFSAGTFCLPVLFSVKNGCNNSLACLSNESSNMTARLTEKAVFVWGGILLLLPCIATEGSGTLDDCDDGGDAFLKPDCVTTTIEGQLFIGVIIVAVVLILAFILCCCCCYYHCCNKKGWSLLLSV